MKENTSQLVYDAEGRKRDRLANGIPDPDDWEGGDEAPTEYWRYYANAKEVLNRVPGYKFEITATVQDGFRWLKVLTSPANGLKDSTQGLTRYLTPVLEPEDYEVIQDFVLDNCNNDMKFFAYLLPVICLGEGDARSKIRRGIAQELNMAAGARASIILLHGTDLSKLSPPPEEVVSFIPEFQQFPPALVSSGLTFYDFLQWFYDTPEKESFALHVGRAATGPQGAQLTGESQALQHSYRQAIIIKGNPLLGKSYFNEFLVSGFRFCGLKTATIQDLNTRFGHGEWLAAAWSYADDTTRAMLNGFYNSPVLKTACSNGLVKSEGKGTNSFDIKALCAPVLLANDTDSRDMAKADSGNANRIRILNTVLMETAKSHKWPQDSCLASCPGALPADVIIFLCRKYKVEPDLLAAYFIRLCVDYFRSFSLIELLDKCNHLGESLYSRTNATSLQALANACVWSSIALTPYPEDCALWPEQNQHAVNSAEFIFKSLIDFSHFRCRKKGDPFYKIRVALYLDYLEQGKPATHPYRGFEAYAFSAIKSTAIAADVYAREMKSKGLEAVTPSTVFTKVFQGLVDAQGVSSQYSLAILQEKWKDALYIGFTSLIATSERVRQILRREGCFDEVLGEVLSSPITAKTMDGNSMIFEEQFVGTDFKDLTTVKYHNVLGNRK
jgi:hypothetical protein